jgi:hypothetical protein
MMTDMYDYLKTIIKIERLNQIKQEAIEYHANKKP